VIRASQIRGYPYSVYGRGAIIDFHSGGWLDAEDQAYIESVRMKGRLTSGVYGDLFRDNNLNKAETMQVAERRSRKADRSGSPFFADNTIDWEKRWEDENANYQLALAKKRAAIATRKKEELDAMAEEYRRYEEDKKQNKITQLERDAEWNAAAPSIDGIRRKGPNDRYYRTNWSIWSNIDKRNRIINRGRVRYVADEDQDLQTLLINSAFQRKNARCWEEFDQEQAAAIIRDLYRDQYQLIKEKILTGIADGKMHKIDDLLAGIVYEASVLKVVVSDLQNERNIVYQEQTP